MRTDFSEKHVKIFIEMFNISFIHAADFDIVVGLDPPRKTAEFPFGTDVRPRTDDRHKAGFFGFAEKGFDVESAGKIEFAGSWFV